MNKKEITYIVVNVLVMILHLAFTITNLAVLSTLDCNTEQIE
jgi:hypothetical protein